MIGRGEQIPSLDLGMAKVFDQFLFRRAHGSIGMRCSQENDVLLDLAHLAGFALDGPMRGEKEDRVQGNYGESHVGPAAAVHVFMIQRNDHGDASTSR